MKDHWGPMSETTKNDKRPKDALRVLCGPWRRLFPSRILTRLADDRRGVIIIMFALMLPIMLGFIGLAVEVSLWFVKHRELQSAADAAAIAGSYELQDGNSTATITTVSTAEATQNGLDTGSGDTITVNVPPSSGAFTANSTAVEVVLTKQVALLFSGYFLDSARTINARAVAVTTSTGTACILALNSSADSALKISGNINLTMDCDMAVKSSSSKGLDLSGNSDIDVNGICVKGGTNNSGNNTFLDATPTNGCKAASDPLGGLVEPAEADDPCDVTDKDISGNSQTITLNPGVYCNGIKISGGSNTITFNDGTYILAGGNGLSVSGGSNTLIAAGATFYITDNHGDGNYPDVNFSGNNTLDLTAPTSGDYAGVLFYNDSSTASSTSGAKFNVSGNNTFDNFDGTVYYPNHEISFSGNSTTASSCGPKLLSDTVSISGNITVFGGGTGCASSNVNIGTSEVIGLVE